jgi:hypothetical protein
MDKGILMVIILLIIGIAIGLMIFNSALRGQLITLLSLDFGFS